MQETRVQFLGQEDPLEKEMATHSSILAWRIHGQRSQQAVVDEVTRVGHDLETKPPQWNTTFILFLFIFKLIHDYFHPSILICMEHDEI